MDRPTKGLPSSETGPPKHVKLFVPILAGATLRDRIVACLGALLGIGLTGLVSGLAVGRGIDLPLLVAPMGASAVLLFAVPASPLAQPWSIIGGNTISALVGVMVVRVVPEPTLAAALAVALAIGAMSLLRCLHPPGGAAALTAVLGGPAVVAAGYAFPFVPVALNSALLVLTGWAFHKAYRRHHYPHVPAPHSVPTPASPDASRRHRMLFRPEDVDEAVADLGETLDIDRGDLDRLLRRVELRSFSRSHGDLRGVDIMSETIIHGGLHTALDDARRMLLDRAGDLLPVLDDAGRVLGVVGLRELIRPGTQVSDIIAQATTAAAETLAVDLVEPLTNGGARAVLIVDEAGRLLGMVTPGDLLTALSRSA